jgi:hypothetical protein
MVGLPTGTLRAVVWSEESKPISVAKDTARIDKLAKWQVSRVFEGISWSEAESATLRAALKCYTESVSVSLSSVHLATIELKLARAVHASGYTVEELESWLFK